MTPIISVNHLTKTYRVPQREPGLRASLRSLPLPSFLEEEAVKNIAFSIQPGEMVALIGPNSAGKTTNLDMLTGLLLLKPEFTFSPSEFFYLWVSLLFAWALRFL